jgi:hypothetical protein
MPNQTKQILKRRYFRFPPDHGTFAEIDLSPEQSGKQIKFSPDFRAKVFQEAFQGCGIVTERADTFNVGDICCVKVGHVGPVLAEVRWRNEVDHDRVMVGLKYLE